MKNLTQEQLKAALNYNPETGVFTWKKSYGQRPAGAEAGFEVRKKDKLVGVYVSINASMYAVHHLAILWATGRMPTEAVTHVNGDKSDNRIVNLREGADPKDTKELTQQKLKSLLDYDPDTGVFTWKKAYGQRLVGDVAGYESRVRGRLIGIFICISATSYAAHRLAILWTTGQMPTDPVSHINGDTSDNRIANLRVGLEQVELTQEYLKAILDYDGETGVFTWKRSQGKARAGAQAGCMVTHPSGTQYRQIDVNGKPYKAHHLALLWATGQLPTGRVIHLNRDKDDNRIENIQEVVKHGKAKELTQSTLKALLEYDPKTGMFTWLTSQSNRAPIGSLANSISDDGYYRIRVKGKSYRAHRLVWLYVYGKFPDGDIDHINGDTLDNRIENLRDVTKAGNQQNQRRAHTRNKTGHFGASEQGFSGKYRARIRVNGKVHYLGLFNTPEEASKAYVEAKRRLHSTCTI